MYSNKYRNDVIKMSARLKDLDVSFEGWLKHCNNINKSDIDTLYNEIKDGYSKEEKDYSKKKRNWMN